MFSLQLILHPGGRLNSSRPDFKSLPVNTILRLLDTVSYVNRADSILEILVVEDTTELVLEVVQVGDAFLMLISSVKSVTVLLH